AGLDSEAGEGGALCGVGLRSGCGGKNVHQAVRKPTERTMNRIVRRAISARDRSRRGAAGGGAEGGAPRGQGPPPIRGARSPARRPPSTRGGSGRREAEAARGNAGKR